MLSENCALSAGTLESERELKLFNDHLLHSCGSIAIAKDLQRTEARGNVSAIVEGMTRFSTNSKAQMQACGALRHLASRYDSIELYV